MNGETRQELLFIYGTLRRGAQFPLEKFLGRWVVFLGKAMYQGRLLDLGAYPGLIPSDRTADRVVGDLYRVLDAKTVFSRLDVYEDYRPDQPEQSLYLRLLETVHLQNGSTRKAWIYVYNGSREGTRVIPGGDYVQYLASRRKNSF